MTEVRLAGAGGAIVAVQPGSPAEAADIRPTDRLVAINGRQLRDVIDYQYYSNDDKLSLEVERDGATLTIHIRKDDGAPLGLEFADPTFDRLRTCNNNCPFCFLKGLPRGLYSRWLVSMLYILKNEPPWNALLQDQLGRSVDRVIMESRLPHVPIQRIVEGNDAHADVMRHVSADDGFSRPRCWTRVIHSIPESVGAKRAFSFE
jgi:membrane-associated protease RseP (regulator of RpoE activity)